MLWELTDISFLYSSGEGTLQDGDGGFLSTVLDQVMARGQVERSLSSVKQLFQVKFWFA
jgi:hypothetical protein